MTEHRPGINMTLFSTEEMSAVFSSEAHIRSMLRFEAALAHAEARAGVIPHEAATSIEASCKEELFDIPALYRAARKAGTLAIPLVRALTGQVEGEARRYVHWGATSQDVIDTALMLQMREGIDLLVAGLLDIAGVCAKWSEQHRHTLMVGRTLLQHALPITFGLKAARWLAMVTRLIGELRERQKQKVVLQLGGAAGTLASLGEKGLLVGAYLAEELQLAVPDLPWHTERDRIGEIATSVAVVAGAMAKIANDVVLLSQSEVGEVVEGEAEGKGGSSAMPQKRNPVDTTRAIASARLAVGAVPVLLSGMVQEHERDVGGWQAEWTAIPELFCFAAGAVEGVRAAVVDLEIDPARMRANLDLTKGLIMAESLTLTLAEKLGRSEAYRLVQEVCQQVVTSGKTLRQVVQDESRIQEHLSVEEIDLALDPENYSGSTGTLIDRALAGYQQILQ
jgi:3-carboxy-cis,cis-muconate cycloisomerase